MQLHKSPLSARALAVWRWLTIPTFPEHTPHARAIGYLVTMTVVLVVIMALLTLVMQPLAQNARGSQWYPARDVALMLPFVTATYLMARWGPPQFAISFAIASSIAGVSLISLPQVTGSQVNYEYLYLLIIPVTYANIFLSIRAVFVTLVITLFAAALVFLIGSGYIPIDYGLLVGFLVIASTVSTVGNFYRSFLEQRNHRDLTENADRLRLIAENIAETIIVTNADGLIEYISVQDFELLGVSPAEIIGMNIFGPRFVALRHPDDLPRVQTSMKQAVDTITTSTLEYRVKALNGDYVWIEMTMHFMTHPDGTIDRIIFVGRDINERKLMEFNRLEQERVRAELDKEVELSATRVLLMQRLSHEFRTPLTLLQTSAELLHHYSSRMSPEQRDERFARIRENVAQMNTMLTDIMHIVELQEKTDLPMETRDLELYSQEALAHWQARAPERTFILHTAGNLHALPTPVTLLDPIVENLLQNAVRYSPAGTPITLTLVREGGFLILAVCDEGSTLLPEDAAHLFEPFYRGREVQNIAGSGLGLYITQVCVERWGGTIGVEVKPGVGTTFRVRLPEVVQ